MVSELVFQQKKHKKGSFYVHLKKNYLNFNLFFLGVIIFDSFNLFNTVYGDIYMRIPQIFGLIIVIFSSIKLIYFRIDNKYLKSVFKIFIVWNLLIILRFDKMSVDEIRLVLFQPIHFFSYLIPLVILLPINRVFLIFIFRYSLFLSLLFVPIYFFFSVYLLPQNNITDLMVTTYISGASLLFLTWYYHKIWIRRVAVLALFVALMAGLIAGRRSIILNTFLVFSLGYGLILFYYQKINILKKSGTIIFILIFIILILDSVDLYRLDIFDTLRDRVNTDSRSDVFLAFFKDFKGFDWVFGRGIDGTYFNPIKYWNYSNDESRDVTFRENIENGYLFLILKGGAISLVLFMLIALPAIYLAIFKSKNIISKGAGFFVLIYLVDMFTFGQPALSMKYTFVWLCISICYSNEIRLIPESLMRNYIIRLRTHE